MVTTTLLATKAPVVVAPAMNTGMYDNPVTQRNLAALRKRGFHIIEPDCRPLACATAGRASCPDTPTLLWGIEKALTEQDLRQARSCYRRPDTGGHGPRFGSCPTTPPAKWVTRSRPAQPCAALTQRFVPTDRARYTARCHARGYCFRAGYVRRGDEPRTRAGFHHHRLPPSVITVRRRLRMKSSKKVTAR